MTVVVTGKIAKKFEPSKEKKEAEKKETKKKDS